MFNENDFPHELLLTTRQTTKQRNTFENNMSNNIKLSKAQISKIIQSGGFLGSVLSKVAGPLMKVAVPLAKNILVPLGLTAAASAIHAGKWKITKVLEASNILLNGITKTIGNETKEQKDGFIISMLLGALGASLLGNTLAGKEIVRVGYGNKERKGIVRAGYGN